MEYIIGYMDYCPMIFNTETKHITVSKYKLAGVKLNSPTEMLQISPNIMNVTGGKVSIKYSDNRSLQISTDSEIFWAKLKITAASDLIGEFIDNEEKPFHSHRLSSGDIFCNAFCADSVQPPYDIVGDEDLETLEKLLSGESDIDEYSDYTAHTDIKAAVEKAVNIGKEKESNKQDGEQKIFHIPQHVAYIGRMESNVVSDENVIVIPVEEVVSTKFKGIVEVSDGQIAIQSSTNPTHFVLLGASAEKLQKLLTKGKMDKRLLMKLTAEEKALVINRWKYFEDRDF